MLTIVFMMKVMMIVTDIDSMEQYSTVCVLRDHSRVIDMFIAADGHVVHRLSGYVLAKTVRQTQWWTHVSVRSSLGRSVV